MTSASQRSSIVSQRTSLETIKEPSPWLSYEAEMVDLDYDKAYARKFSEFRDDHATVWTSMYEKNLGRKVSELPPWAVSQSGRKESEIRAFGDPTKHDFASIHKERAKNEGVLHHNHKFVTAEKHREKRKAKRSASSSSTEEGKN